MNQSQIASLPVFATVLLGGFRNEANLFQDLVSSGKKISFPAQDLLKDEDFKCTPCDVHSVEITLVSVNTEMFGFKYSVGYNTFYECARKTGLLLCPHDTGPVHFLRNEKVLGSERIFYGSRPIGQNNYIFSASRWGGENRLGAFAVEEEKGSYISSNDQVLFVRA